MEHNQEMLELLRKIEKSNRQKNVTNVIMCVFMLAAAASCVFIGLMVFRLMPQVNGLLSQLETVLSDLEQTTGQLAALDLESMVTNMDSLAVYAQESLQQTMEKLDTIDFETLNKAIEDLAKSSSPWQNSSDVSESHEKPPRIHPGRLLLAFHFPIQLLHKLPQGLKQYQSDAEISHTVGDVEGNAGGPFGNGEAEAADEDICNAAEGAEEQTVDTGYQGPGQGLLRLPQKNGDQHQQRPDIQVIHVPDAQAEAENLKGHIHEHRIQCLVSEDCAENQKAQAHRLNVGQGRHDHLHGEDHGAQDAEEDQLPDA